MTRVPCFVLRVFLWGACLCVCGAAARAQLKGEVGTPMWMAPEVLMNESFTFKADVYSFGVIVWELLTGKVPWKGTHSTQQISPPCLCLCLCLCLCF